MNSLSIAPPSATLVDTDDAYTVRGDNNGGPVRLGGDGWTVSQSKSWKTRSEDQTSFNPNGYGNPAARGNTPSVSGTAHTFNSNFTEPSNTQQSARGPWAKIKACVCTLSITYGSLLIALLEGASSRT